MKVVALLTSTVVGDGAVEPLEVGRVYALPLALHGQPSALSQEAAAEPGRAPLQAVTGRVAVLQRHEHGGALVLVGPGETPFVVHLLPSDPPVEAGQELTVRGHAFIDPWAWYCGPDFPDSDDVARPWHVVRLQRRTAPLVPVPGSPGTVAADLSRARHVDVPAVERWYGAGQADLDVEHLVTLEPAGEHAGAEREPA